MEKYLCTKSFYYFNDGDLAFEEGRIYSGEMMDEPSHDPLDGYVFEFKFTANELGHPHYLSKEDLALHFDKVAAMDEGRCNMALGTLVIENVDLAMLEEQRVGLNAILDKVRDAPGVFRLEGADVAVLEGIGGMLDAWSDANYFDNQGQEI